MNRLVYYTILLIFLTACDRRAPVILQEPHSFLMLDGRVDKIAQAGDTIYSLSCFINQPCSSNVTTAVKIISVREESAFVLLAIRWLGVSEWHPAEKQYSIWLWRRIDENKLMLSAPLYRMTRNELDTFSTQHLDLPKVRYLTYYSDRYLAQLSSLRQLSTLDDAAAILDDIPGNNFRAGKISYSAEELNQACIRQGFNPVGAGLMLDTLLQHVLRNQ